MQRRPILASRVDICASVYKIANGFQVAFVRGSDQCGLSELIALVYIRALVEQILDRRGLARPTGDNDRRASAGNRFPNVGANHPPEAHAWNIAIKRWVYEFSISMLDRRNTHARYCQRQQRRDDYQAKQQLHTHKRTEPFLIILMLTPSRSDAKGSRQTKPPPHCGGLPGPQPASGPAL